MQKLFADCKKNKKICNNINNGKSETSIKTATSFYFYMAYTTIISYCIFHMTQL